MPRIIRVALAGLGSVNRALVLLLEQKRSELAEKFKIAFQITAVADSRGVAFCAEGFDPLALHSLKAKGGYISALPGSTAAPGAFTRLLSRDHCDLLFEGTPVAPHTGEPGLGYTRQALQQGLDVVLANKGPLIRNYTELMALARVSQCRLAYSATVCGGLPVINIGQRDLVAAQIQEIRGIFNSTTNYLLAQMEEGASFEEALAEAQRRGIAEADPGLDVDGWDTANKLVIIANSILDSPTTLADIAVMGIRDVTSEQLQQAQQRGQIIKLVATAKLNQTGYQLSVAPTTIDRTSFLGSCHGWEMGIEFHTDIYGILYHKSWEDTATPTAAAMLRDAVNIAAHRG